MLMRTLSSGISGLRAHQTMMDVVSNDIANASTPGYKSARVDFSDTLSQLSKAGSAAGSGLGSVNPQQIGLGAQVNSVSNLMGQGPLDMTSNPLDLAIRGEGFFRVTSDPTAFTEVQYTRAGDFQLDANGDLSTKNGWKVVGLTINAGPPPTPTATPTVINIPANAKSVTIGQDGLVSWQDGAGVTTNVAYVSLAKLPNPAGMERVANNRWAVTVASGNPTNTSPGQTGTGWLASGALEQSNVELSGQFASMITAQRGFQANSRSITTADEMLRELVQMKR